MDHPATATELPLPPRGVRSTQHCIRNHLCFNTRGSTSSRLRTPWEVEVDANPGSASNPNPQRESNSRGLQEWPPPPNQNLITPSKCMASCSLEIVPLLVIFGFSDWLTVSVAPESTAQSAALGLARHLDPPSATGGLACLPWRSSPRSTLALLHLTLLP